MTDILGERPLGVTLILGGARSGKSAFAESWIEAHGSGLYLATAQALDDEMSDRIQAHKRRRGGAWEVVEEPLDLAPVLRHNTRRERPVLVDCLTLWLSNLMLADRDIDEAVLDLAGALGNLNGPVVFVSNEVGQGIVPDNAPARRFRDEAGRLHQRIARVADRVVFITAGLPRILKDEPK